MTLEEMVKYLRVSILDDTGGTGVIWKTITDDLDEVAMLRWSNEELTGFINEALRKVCRSSLLLKDRQDSFNITLEDGVTEYALDPRIIRIKEVRDSDKGQRLFEVAHEDTWNDSSATEKTGRPTAYFTDEVTGILSVYPIPTTASGLYNLRILAYREEMTPLSWTTDVDASPEINPRYHIPLLNYAAYLCYLKDEANSLDTGRAQQFLSLFYADFDDNSIHSEIRKNRSRRGTVAYGGY